MIQNWIKTKSQVQEKQRKSIMIFVMMKMIKSNIEPSENNTFNDEFVADMLPSEEEWSKDNRSCEFYI